MSENAAHTFVVRGKSWTRCQPERTERVEGTEIENIIGKQIYGKKEENDI